MRFFENYPLFLTIALFLWIIWHHLGFWGFLISIVVLFFMFIAFLLLFAIALGLAMENKYNDYERYILNKPKDERNE